MLIYLVRHGQTTGNKEKRFQRADTPLSPEGEIQSQKISDRLQDVTIDEIWTSPMLRAEKTAEFINAYHHAPMRVIAELSELRRATSLVGKAIDDPEIAELGSKLQELEIGDANYKYEDGESYAECVTRVQKIVDLLVARAKEVPDDHTLCVTSHGILLATLFQVVLLGDMGTADAMMQGIRRLRHANTGLSVMKVSPDGTWKILTFSDFAHL